MSTIFFSKIGLERKRRQIELQENKIKTLQKEVADAAGISNDWHDNFYYEDATRQLDIASSLLRQLLEEIRNARIIDPEEQARSVLIGTTVKLSADGKEYVYTIGAYGETDLSKDLISYTSPMASGLLNMQVGDSKTIGVGDKSIIVLIKEILPPSYRYVKEVLIQ